MDGAAARLAKRIAPAMSRIGSTKSGAKALRFGELYLAVLQGKGSGTGWDIDGEAIACRAFVQGTSKPVIFDVGANLGEWSESVNDAINDPDANFVLFEPASACREALEALDVPNKRFVRSGVGATSGEAWLQSDVPGSGAASIYERRESYFGDMSAYREHIEILTIDEFAKENGFDRISYLKIDVEGAEMDVMRGMSRVIAERRVESIAFEFGSANIYARNFFRDFWELLTPAGYRIWRITPGGRLVPITEYAEDLENFRGVSNYVASIREPEPVRRRLRKSSRE